MLSCENSRTINENYLQSKLLIQRDFTGIQYDAYFCKQALARIYGPGQAEQFVSVGNLASAESIPALVDINKLITRHSAVVGATGAGKSTTVAGILRSLTEPRTYPSATVAAILCVFVIRQRSKKTAKVYLERRKLVARLLAERPWCERHKRTQVSITGGARSTDIHELLSRARGGSILDEANCVALCRECHNWVHQNPAKAQEEGWLKPRFACTSGR